MRRPCTSSRISRTGNLPVWVLPVFACLCLWNRQAARPNEFAKTVGAVGVLPRILQKTTTFDGARVGALGVLAPYGQLARCAPAGMCPACPTEIAQNLGDLGVLPEILQKTTTFDGTRVGALGTLTGNPLVLCQSSIEGSCEPRPEGSGHADLPYAKIPFRCTTPIQELFARTSECPLASPYGQALGAPERAAAARRERPSIL